MIISNLFFVFLPPTKRVSYEMSILRFAIWKTRRNGQRRRMACLRCPKTRTTVGSPPSRILKWLVDARAPIRCVSRSSLYGLSNKRSHPVKCAAEAGTLHHRLCHGRRRSMSAGIPFFFVFFCF